MDITIPYYDAQRNFTASPGTILRYVENAAAEHCAEIGWDIPRLMEHGYAWILSKGQLEMKRYPRYRENFSIETWISERSAVHTWREYQIIDSRGELIGASRGNWVFVDTARRRPVKIIDDFIRYWPLNPVRSINREIPKRVTGPEVPDSRVDFPVRRGDIDTNKHVNNVRYLEWALESLPEEWLESKELSYIEGCFKHETHYGNDIVSVLQHRDKGFIHSIVDKDDGRELAAALSEWR
jgi:acyl-ACP thioesterase